MGNLSHLINQDSDDSLNLITQMQAKLKKADNTLATMSGMLEERLTEANNELKDSLSGVMDDKVVKSVNRAIGSMNVSTNKVISGIKALASDIRNIPSYPPPQDVVPHLKKLEAKITKRTHVFEVDRDPLSDLIKTITVRTK